MRSQAARQGSALGQFQPIQGLVKPGARSDQNRPSLSCRKAIRRSGSTTTARPAQRHHTRRRMSQLAEPAFSVAIGAGRPRQRKARSTAAERPRGRHGSVVNQQKLGVVGVGLASGGRKAKAR